MTRTTTTDKLQESYDILGVSPDATNEEIRQAYRDLAQIWHPDRYAHNPRLQKRAEENFKEINAAYDLIMEHCLGSDVSAPQQPVDNSQADFSTEVESKSPLAQFVVDLFKLTPSEQKELESQIKKKIKKKTSVEAWKGECVRAGAAVGGLSGFMGGFVGAATLVYDLGVLKKRASAGGFGIGHLLGCEVDYALDRDMILALWAGEGTLEKRVPEGKVGIKLNNQGVSEEAAIGIMGGIVSKTVLKLSFKFLAKLSTKVVAKALAKISTKLVVKTGGSWIPFAGSVVSGGINIWLLKGFLNTAEEYYLAQKANHAVYLVLVDNEVASTL